MFRLDAIAFLWKRMGTSCQNEPEVHAITQAMRAVARIACPAVVFKAEAIVGPADLVQYLGTGRHHGKVSDLAYHNGLMVQVWSMLAAKDATLASHALRALPPIPSTTAWVTYVRCHDDIGWAIADEDAAAVGLDGYRHRHFLSDWYAGVFPGSDARGLVFQENAATGDRRISGTTASLVGLEAARAADDPAWVDAAVARLLLAHAVVLGWGGVPVLWSGDELALPNDPGWADEPGHGDDNRWAHRPRLDPAARRATARRRHGRGAGVRGPAAPRARPGVAPAPARVRRERGARSRRPGGAHGRAPAPARTPARRLQRDPRLATGAGVASARARGDPRRADRHGRRARATTTTCGWSRGGPSG